MSATRWRSRIVAVVLGAGALALSQGISWGDECPSANDNIGVVVVGTAAVAADAGSTDDLTTAESCLDAAGLHQDTAVNLEDGSKPIVESHGDLGEYSITIVR